MVVVAVAAVAGIVVVVLRVVVVSANVFALPALRIWEDFSLVALWMALATSDWKIGSDQNSEN